LRNVARLGLDFMSFLVAGDAWNTMKVNDSIRPAHTPTFPRPSQPLDSVFIFTLGGHHASVFKHGPDENPEE
jgi:hypothetical protein